MRAREDISIVAIAYESGPYLLNAQQTSSHCCSSTLNIPQMN